VGESRQVNRKGVCPCLKDGIMVRIRRSPRNNQVGDSTKGNCLQITILIQEKRFDEQGKDRKKTASVGTPRRQRNNKENKSVNKRGKKNVKPAVQEPDPIRRLAAHDQENPNYNKPARSNEKIRPMDTFWKGN